MSDATHQSGHARNPPLPAALVRSRKPPPATSSGTATGKRWPMSITRRSPAGDRLQSCSAPRYTSSFEERLGCGSHRVTSDLRHAADAGRVQVRGFRDCALTGFPLVACKWPGPPHSDTPPGPHLEPPQKKKRGAAYIENRSPTPRTVILCALPLKAAINAKRGREKSSPALPAGQVWGGMPTKEAGHVNLALWMRRGCDVVTRRGKRLPAPRHERQAAPGVGGSSDVITTSFGLASVGAVANFARRQIVLPISPLNSQSRLCP